MDKKEIDKMLEILNFCIGNITEFPLFYQLKIIAIMVEASQKLEPIYKHLESGRQNELTDILKSLLE